MKRLLSILRTPVCSGILFLFINPGLLISQENSFLSSGKIIYERKINAKAVMWDMLAANAIKEPGYQKYISDNPPFKTARFLLYYKDNKTSFLPASPEKMTPVSNDEWFSMVSNDNIVHIDLSKQIYTATKKVFGATYNLEDSVPPIKWKITNEFRTIAGFECRRANAVLRDSIYIVAFYTTDLHISGGPESFTGLPGMILGLALPHDHVTWFATAVDPLPIDYNSDKSAQIKGPKSSVNQYEQKIRDMIKSWGNAGNIIFRKIISY